MSEAQTEINTKLDTLLSGIKDAQDVADRNKKRIDSLDNDQMKRINEDVTKSLEQVNILQAKQEKLEEQNNKIQEQNALIEKMVCNTGAGAKDNSAVRVLKTKNAVTNLLRTGLALPLEMVKENAKELIDKNYFGVSDAEKSRLQKDFEVVSDPNGGYWVDHEMSSLVIAREFETSPMRQICTVNTTGTDAVEFIIDDELLPNGGWVGETETRTGTGTNEIGKKIIYIHEIYAEPKATQKMLDDAGFDLETYIFNGIVTSFSLTENSAFVVGDSVAKPKGFLTYDPWAVAGVYEREKLEYIPSTKAASFESDDIKDLQNSLIDFYQNGANFVMNRKTFGTVTKLKEATTGAYLLDPNSLKVGDTRILLGSKVVFFSDMPDEAADSLCIAYGNFKRSYMIIDRIGIRMIRDVYTKKGYVKFYTTKRLGADVVNYQGIKILQCANS